MRLESCEKVKKEEAAKKIGFKLNANPLSQMLGKF